MTTKPRASAEALQMISALHNAAVRHAKDGTKDYGDCNHAHDALEAYIAELEEKAAEFDAREEARWSSGGR